MLDDFKFFVQGEFRRYTGLHLMKHALHNTIPDITKKARKLIDGEWREVKVRDGEKIQQANKMCIRDRDMLAVRGCDLQEKQTRPRPLHTESILLAAMERCV